MVYFIGGPPPTYKTESGKSEPLTFTQAAAVFLAAIAVLAVLFSGSYIFKHHAEAAVASTIVMFICWLGSNRFDP